VGVRVDDSVVNVFEGRTVGAVNQDVKLAEALTYLRGCAAAGERVVWVDDLHVPGFVEHDGIVTMGTSEDAGLTAPLGGRGGALLGGGEASVLAYSPCQCCRPRFPDLSPAFPGV